MFQTLFLNVFTVFLMIIPGYLLIRKNIISEATLKDLSQIIIKVLYPALIFSSITKGYSIEKVLESWQLPVSVFILCVIGYVVGLIFLGFFKHKDLQRRKAILFQMTINNFSFLPLAIIAKLYDEQHMAALILSTLGAEISVWTIGMSILNKKEEGFKLENLKHLLSPPLISIYFSLVVLLILHYFNLTLPEVLEKSVFINYTQKTIYQLGQAAIPISLIMVGGRMGKIKFKELLQVDYWSVMLFRLLIIPLLGVVILQYLFPSHPYLNVMLIVAVMPNSISSLVLGELYGADQKLMSGTVLLSHLISLITIPLWLLFLL
ncbi:AEC family transporter [Labilibacter marinus]|uniref:AEC family transporter n=1 Tax=Labilibacter marinus TaxID=1477105 RepID=UPI00082D15B7|nr:AEC family transporter [Labilibacter marinus]